MLGGSQSASAVSLASCDLDTAYCDCPNAPADALRHSTTGNEMNCKALCVGSYNIDGSPSPVSSAQLEIPTAWRISCEQGGSRTTLATGPISEADYQAGAQAFFEPETAPDPGSCTSGSYTCTCNKSIGSVYDTEVFSTIDTVTEEQCDQQCWDSGMYPGNWFIGCIAEGQRVSLSTGTVTDRIVLVDPNGQAAGTGGAPTTDSNSSFSLLGEGAIIPNLAIAIPGLSREDLEASLARDAEGNIQANLIGVYVIAIYNLLLALASFIAVAVFMVAGFLWLSSGGSASQIGRAKDMMKDALVGLILLFGAYAIGSFIDPRLITFDGLKLGVIQPLDLAPHGEYWNYSGRADIPNNFVQLNDSSIMEVRTASDYLINEASIKLQEAVRTFNSETGERVLVTSAARSTYRQLELFYDKCLANGGICSPAVCNPSKDSDLLSYSGGKWTLTGSLENVTDRTQILEALNAVANSGDCPHTSGVGIDIWCMRNKGSDYAYEPECQTQLQEVLIDAGFCRLRQEPWHFEYNRYALSSSCTQSTDPSYVTRQGATITPDPECTQWSFQENRCISN